MKIYKEKEELVAYKEIDVSQCFEYNRCVYFKCYDNIPGGKIYDVDLTRGTISPSLDDDTLVKPLYDAMIYTHKIREE